MGEASCGILDIQEGKQIHNLWGHNFSLAPNKRFLLFIRGTPRIYLREEYKFLLNDYVMLAFVEKGQPVTRENVSSNLTAMTVYPEISPFGEMVERSYRDLHERHFIKSGFSWSPDSRRVAFVEEHRRAFYLVVLDLDVRDSEVRSVPRTFRLAEKLGEVTAVEWVGEERVVRVVAQDAVYRIDLERGTIRRQSG